MAYRSRSALTINASNLLDRCPVDLCETAVDLAPIEDGQTVLRCDEEGRLGRSVLSIHSLISSLEDNGQFIGG